ncbi:MAG: hypothetical protein ACOX4M_07655 [Acetivibrionales bacterium]
MNTFGNIIRYTLVLVLLLNLFLLTGCFDQREIDELAYPMAIGLDVGEANELRMTLQLAVPISIGGGSGGARKGAEEAAERRNNVNYHRRYAFDIFRP